jgi:hypothetical protein
VPLDDGVGDRVFYFFGDSPHSELPCAETIFFEHGIELPVSLVDIGLIRGLLCPSAILDSPDPLSDTFAICTQARYFPQWHDVPPTDESAACDPVDQFRKRRNFHSFLSQQSARLHQFEQTGRSAHRILDLQITSLARSLGDVDPA